MESTGTCSPEPNARIASSPTVEPKSSAFLQVPSFATSPVLGIKQGHLIPERREQPANGAVEENRRAAAVVLHILAEPMWVISVF